MRLFRKEWKGQTRYLVMTSTRHSFSGVAQGFSNKPIFVFPCFSCVFYKLLYHCFLCLAFCLKCFNAPWISDQPRGLMVGTSDYLSRGPGFDFRIYHGNFPCRGRIPVVTTVWVVSRSRLKVETSSISSINSDWTHEISSLEGASSR